MFGVSLLIGLLRYRFHNKNSLNNLNKGVGGIYF